MDKKNGTEGYVNILLKLTMVNQVFVKQEKKSHNQTNLKFNTENKSIQIDPKTESRIQTNQKLSSESKVVHKYKRREPIIQRCNRKTSENRVSISFNSRHNQNYNPSVSQSKSKFIRNPINKRRKPSMLSNNQPKQLQK